MKKKCSVWLPNDVEKQIRYLTPAQIVEYRRDGYYVRELE
jgi:hypothetical protein